MNRQDKGAIIQDLSEKFANNPFFYITDASGMTVATTNKLRRLCYERGIEYKVVKNTLIEKALETLDTDYTPFKESVLTGFSGIMFHPESGKDAAKLIKDFLKENKDSISLKGASIDAELFIGHDQLDMLANLKSKAELIGDVIMLLQSPAKTVIGGLQSGGNKLAGILKTLSEKEAA
ncbi:50S ribosomal protein L10 [Arcticibacterium luteifluviistationis]|uniref:Large ribosomal subunit protein uL10 n=1 Tax=Arcticibacterium luteifluviistationis TaxID=1784714 RepID=A0A2Z4GDC1_9BACT|nr:50S ribosomal protein L10 [Arcticibacterium luteifluviistationis]AWV99322.1 50S ribosomal protein L10 [Arcticibacterium luteifluviistationis]